MQILSLILPLLCAGRDVELAKNAEEIRGLKLSHIAKDKAAAKVGETERSLSSGFRQPACL